MGASLLAPNAQVFKADALRRVGAREKAAGQAEIDLVHLRIKRQAAACAGRLLRAHADAQDAANPRSVGGQAQCAAALSEYLPLVVGRSREQVNLVCAAAQGDVQRTGDACF